MKLPKALHRWDLSPKRAVALQRDLAARVVESPLPHEPQLIAGGDCAFAEDGTVIIAGWVVWHVASQKVVEQVVVRRPVRFPYVPGLLSFREAPALLAAARRLKAEPDLFLIDGHGRAHLRGLGLACHLGLWLDRPTIGCGKSRLCGVFDEPPMSRGSRTVLRLKDEIVGVVLRTQNGLRPIYVSVGHRTELESAARIVLSCATRFRMPEPTRLADRLVAAEKR